MNTSIDLASLAWDLESHGLSGRNDAVLRVARWARVAGVNRVLVDVLADPSAPEPARLRAFGRIATELAHVAARTEPAAA
jgi:hypothetical protein